MPIHVRPRGQKSFELRIIHALLAKAVYFTFSTETEAHQHGTRALAYLDRGVVPDGLVSPPKGPFVTISDGVAAYGRAVAAPESTLGVLRALVADVGDTKFQSVSYEWVESWVRSQKVEMHRAPGTIRHHVGALSRM